MSRYAAILSAEIHLSLGVPLAAQNSPDVGARIRELGGDEWAVRDEAARRLLMMGFQARPALLAASEDENPQIASSARKILGTVDREFVTNCLAGEDRLEIALRE